MAAIRQSGALGVTANQTSSAGPGFPRAFRPDPVCRDDSWAVVRRAYQVAYVTEAWMRAQVFYVGPAILRHAGQDLLELIKGILPGLLLAFGGVLITTGLGALAGGIVGGIAGGGVGAAPGAVYGGELGLTVGLWLLEYLGLAVLAVYFMAGIREAGRYLAEGVVRAWNSCGSAPAIDAAARDMGEAFGFLLDALSQAIVAFVAEEGMALALKKLNQSKIAEGWAAFFRTKTFREATVSYWLKKLGRPKEPQLVRERVAVVVEFLRDKARGPGGERLTSKKIDGVLRGTDFNGPVASAQDMLHTFKRGEILTQRPDPVWQGGNWFTKSGYSADSTGLAAGGRGFKRYEVVQPFESLASKAAGIEDTWTTGRAAPADSPQMANLRGQIEARTGKKTGGAGEMAQGGGLQFFAEKPVADLVAQGYLREYQPEIARPGPRPERAPR